MTQTLPPRGAGPAPLRAAAAARESRATRWIVTGSVLLAAGAGTAAALYGSTAAYGLVGVALAVLLFTTAALYPIFATYSYLLTLPIIAGIDRDTLLPLVRP